MSKMSTAMNLDLQDRSLGGEDGNEDNMVAPEVHQRGVDVNPFSTSSSSRNETSKSERRTCEALLRPSRIARWPPIARGPTCYVHVKATRCWLEIARTA
jgi:hypothetical protein